MIEKKFTGAPFGSQVSRFDVSQVHPRLKVPGSYTEYTYESRCLDESVRANGPGRYYKDDTCVPSRCKSINSGWARQLEVERMAKTPHLLYKDQWEAKKILAQRLGPGLYEAPQSLLIGNLPSISNRGVCEPREDRFREATKLSVPGPGTYGKNGIPDSALMEKENKSASTLGMMEAPPALYPDSRDKVPGPGSYNQRSFTDDFVPSTGPSPFERYSYDRTKPIKTGHYATLRTENLGPGQYAVSSTVNELLYNKYKKKHGQFGKIARFPSQYTDRQTLVSSGCYTKNKNLPGPGHYNPVDYVNYYGSAKLPPFMSSAPQRKGFMRSRVPGVGRYDVQKWDDSQHNDGHTNLFKSKSSVRTTPSMIKSLTERLKGKGTYQEYREECAVQGNGHSNNLVLHRCITAM